MSAVGKASKSGLQALKALLEYKGTAAPEINEVLRSGSKGRYEKHPELIRSLAEPLPEGAELSRHSTGIFDEAGDTIDHNLINEGDILANKAFASTTYDFNDPYMHALTDVNYSNDLPFSSHFIIRAEPGTEHIDLAEKLKDIYPSGFHDHEAEVLLMPGQKYMVMGKEPFRTEQGNSAMKYFLQTPSDEMEGFESPIKGYIASMLGAAGLGSGLTDEFYDGMMEEPQEFAAGGLVAKKGVKALQELLDNMRKAHPERLQRAEEVGFDTSKVWLHGTPNEFESFKPNQYFSDSPIAADFYSSNLPDASLFEETSRHLPVFLKNAIIDELTPKFPDEKAMYAKSGRPDSVRSIFNDFTPESLADEKFATGGLVTESLTPSRSNEEKQVNYKRPSEIIATVAAAQPQAQTINPLFYGAFKGSSINYANGGLVESYPYY